MNRRKKRRYEDISLPVRKVFQIGSSLGITIPAAIIKKYDIRKGDSFPLTIHKRILYFSDEVTPKEERQDMVIEDVNRTIQEEIQKAIKLLDSK